MAETLELPTDFSKNCLHQIISDNLSSADFSVEIKQGSAKGDNYLGIIYRVKAVDNKSKKEFNVIVKLPPQNEIRRKQFLARPSFLREIFFYDQVFPLFANFQKEKGVEIKSNGFYEIPHCFQTSTTELEEGLFMEDLKVKNFEMYDRHKPITFDHCRIVVEILGKFHALSFAMKDQQPEKFEPFTKMVEIFLQHENEASMNEWFGVMKDRAYSTLDAAADSSLIQKMEKIMDKPFQDMVSGCTNGEEAEPYSVINHGDCWNNNILFKHRNGVPVAARLLDWQILRYASPVCDLLYFLFSITTKAFRDEHYEHLLHIYHESLSEFVRRLGSDPEKLFPYSALEDQLKKFGKFGLVMIIMILPVITTCADDVPDLEEMAGEFEEGLTNSAVTNQFCSAATQDSYRERMSSAMRDMERLGYI